MKYYIVDAFTDQLFSGNPAGVIVTQKWLSEELMQKIAFENNLAETCFAVPSDREDAEYEIRWFTPVKEAALCGHGTLATSHIILTYIEPGRQQLRFWSHNNGVLGVNVKGQGRYELDFPTLPAKPVEITQQIVDALGGIKPKELYLARIHLAVLESDKQVRELVPNLNVMMQLPEGRGVAITARGDDCDFVSRVFAPKSGLWEDPVNGSSHSTSGPYWAQQLGKNEMLARMRSKRGGTLEIRVEGDRVFMGGNTVIYLEGELFIDHLIE